MAEHDDAIKSVLELARHGHCTPIHVNQALGSLVMIQRQRDDLAMLVRQLTHALKRHDPDHSLSVRALDYLRRQGLQGNPLRGDSKSES